MMEDVVIVGAGISGLATALGLHRLGIRSLVLESSESLRVSGFALTTWANAWRALDVLGVGDSLRKQHKELHGVAVSSLVSDQPPRELSFKTPQGGQEVRRVKRSALLEALAEELPEESIRFSSKVVCIDEESDSRFKMVHLADGTIIKTKMLIGCDGVNSVVAKWLGFKKAALTGRYAIRGFARSDNGHGLEPKMLQFFGGGVRAGIIPCDDKTVYWFLTLSPSKTDEKFDPSDAAALKIFALQKLADLPDHLKSIIKVTSLEDIVSTPLGFRPPWQVLLGNISKGNVCVAGDALHPMTPDIGQGGCSALEDGVVLARCIGEALLRQKSETDKRDASEESEYYTRTEMGMRKYAKERKWRSFDLISTAFVVGFVQQSKGKMMNMLRDRILAPMLAALTLKKANFDCGNLVAGS